MSKRVLITLAVVIAVAAAAVAQTMRRPPWPCAPGATCGQDPSPGPVVVSDGSLEADAALADVRAALARQGCQLSLEVRIDGAGRLEPRIRVERVVWVATMPSDRPSR